MGRNNKDFYGVFDSKNTNFTMLDGAAVSRSGKDISAVSNEGHEARHTVTRNRDVKKHAARLAKVVTGQAKPLRTDRTTL